MRSIITLRLSSPQTTIEHAQALLEPFGLQVDVRYGLVAISPKRHLFVVRVDGEVAAQALKSLPEVVGVHGDARIAPIGSAGEHDKGD